MATKPDCYGPPAPLSARTALSSPTEPVRARSAAIASTIAAVLLGMGSPALPLPVATLAAVALLPLCVRGDAYDAVRGALITGLAAAISLRWLPLAWSQYTHSPGLPAWLAASVSHAAVGAIALLIAGQLQRRRWPPTLSFALALASAEIVASLLPVPLGFTAGMARSSWLLGPAAIGARPLLAAMMGAFAGSLRTPALCLGVVVVWAASTPALWLGTSGGSERVGIVQTHLSGLDARRVSLHAERADSLIASLPTDVAWTLTPEGAWPWPLGSTERGRADFQQRLSGLSPLLLSGNAHDDGLRNRLALVVDGHIVDHFDKSSLIPYAEGVAPLATGRYAAGDGKRTVVVGTTHIAPLICWEDVLPRSIATVPHFSDILALPSSDVWLGALGQAHHLDAARLAAVTTGRWAVRATPTGHSGLISPRGVVVHAMHHDTAAVVEVERRRRAWLPAYWGQWLGMAAAALSALLIARRP